MNDMKEVKIMKNMKRTLTLLLAAMMFLTLTPFTAFAENGAAEEQRELIVGHPTVMKGDFFTEMFGNDTADIDVRALIHGYNLVNWDQNQGVYVFDPSVVKDVLINDDEKGNRSYYLLLHDDLYYSDGTPITAWDYAFSMLLMMSPEIEQIGGKIYRAEHILGYSAYITGYSKTLTGLEVLSDYQLAITLDADFLPFFFETGLLLCVPYPIAEIAPGCKVYDDGEGVYIGNEDTSIEEPVFTAELLQETIMNPETGYNSHPKAVSGPYTLVSFEDQTAHFEINPYFKGAWVNNSLPGTNHGNYTEHTDKDGNTYYLVKPVIEKIEFRLADNDTLAQELAEGKLDLVNKVVYGPTIDEAKGVAGIENTNYPRIGLAFLTFTFERPAVHDMLVRQAMAWCMDRDALTKAYCGDYGFRVDGYYGIEQWEYMMATHKMNYPANFLDPDKDHNPGDYQNTLDAWEVLSLDNLMVYKVNLDEANRLLDKAGWVLNRDGNAYQAGTDDVRCKEIDGQIVALDLTMMYPEGNHIVDTIQENFIDNLNKCGIQLTLVPEEMSELLKSYYREKERTTDMIYLATNFHVVVDPSITYSTDTTADHQMWNNTYSDDEDLYWRAVNMRKTNPYDVYDYIIKWIAFQERYNEVLPTIPMYSNIYYDFYTEELQNYNIIGHVTWTQAILEAYFGQAPEEAPEEGKIE